MDDVSLSLKKKKKTYATKNREERLKSARALGLPTGLILERGLLA
jgi:hypothetical protein